MDLKLFPPEIARIARYVFEKRIRVVKCIEYNNERPRTISRVAASSRQQTSIYRYPSTTLHRMLLHLNAHSRIVA